MSIKFLVLWGGGYFGGFFWGGGSADFFYGRAECSERSTQSIICERHAPECQALMHALSFRYAWSIRTLQDALGVGEREKHEVETQLFFAFGKRVSEALRALLRFSI